MGVQFFRSFQPQPVNGGVVQVLRQLPVFQLPHAFDLFQLLRDIAVVLDLDLHLFPNYRIQCRTVGVKRSNDSIAQLGTANQVCDFTAGSNAGGAVLFQKRVQFRSRCQIGFQHPLFLLCHKAVFFQHVLIAFLGEQPQFVSQRHQTLVSVVLPQDQPVLAAGSHHAVGILTALGHQIVYQRADIGSGSVHDKRRLALHCQCGIDAGNQSLCGSFLVAGTAVELSCSEQSGNLLALQRCPQFCGVYAVIFDSIRRTHDLHVFQSADRPQKCQLDIFRQRGRHALQIILLGFQPHRLYEKLMPRLVGKADNFGFDRRAVAGADTLDLSGEQRRTVKIFPNDAVGFLVGIGDVAGNLIVHPGRIRAE